MTDLRRSLTLLGQRLGAAKTPQEVAALVLETADEFFSWDAAFLNVYDQDKHQFQIIAAYDVVNGVRQSTNQSGTPTSVSETFLKTMTVGPQLVLRTQQQDPGGIRFGNKARPSATLMYASIQKGDQSVGILSVQTYRFNAYSEKDLETLQAIASYCGGALERAFLEFERLKLAAQQKTFVALGNQLATAVSPREVAKAVLEAADELFGWDCGFIDLLGDTPETSETILSMDIIDGQRAEVLGMFKGQLSPQTNVGIAMQNGSLLILRNASEMEEQTGIRFGNTSRRSASLMYAPLRLGTRNIGIFSVQSYKLNAYTNADLELLQALGNYCSGALDRTNAERDRILAEQRYDIISRATHDVVWDYDCSTDLTWYNDNLERVLGFSRSGAFDREWWKSRLHPDDCQNALYALQSAVEKGETSVAMEYRFARADNNFVHIHDRAYILRNSDGSPYRIIGSMNDITQRKSYEIHLRHNAYHDALTGLPNRIAFTDTLVRALARQSRREDYRFAVLFLDLDRFKNINDSLGHSMGDELLITFARRLQTTLRPGDMVCRLGGDEFTVFLDDLHEVGEAIHVAQRILDTLVQPVTLAGQDVFVSTSIGIALSNADYTNPETLLRDADIAMYGAKAAGRSQYLIFSPDMHASSINLLQLESDLRLALERNEFLLEYQPIVNFSTGMIAGFEALLRWKHPVRGLVAPGDFIPLAEETGLVVPIGKWVLETAAKWVAALEDYRTFVSVNVSSRQFEHSGFVPELIQLVESLALKPGCLKLELTESILMRNRDPEMLVLSSLKKHGIEFQIDDFGTGYSCLSYLERLPLDSLKIDRSFTRKALLEKSSASIIKTIIALAKNLGMKVVAEGIEDGNQLEFLRTLGCDMGQGFYFSDAVSGERATQMSQIPAEAAWSENATEADLPVQGTFPA